MKLKLQSFLLFLIFTIVSLEILNYLNIFPSYRFAQIYWHLTNNDVIENKYIKLKLPVKWIIAKETSSQYFLHGDYIDKNILKTIVIQKKPILNQKYILDLNKHCEIKHIIFKEYKINEIFFELHGCKKLKEGGSLAYIFDKNSNFNMIVYDYNISDSENILELLNAVKIPLERLNNSTGGI